MKVIKEYKRKVKQAREKYLNNRTAENLQAYQIAIKNYNAMKGIG